MTDTETLVQIPETVDEQILKPKKPRKPYDPAVREKMAENMRRINAERLEKARIRSEQNLDKKQDEIIQKAQKKLDAVSKKKAVVQKIKEEKGIPDVLPQPPQPEPEPKPKSAKRSKKQVIVELSSESETDSDSSSSSDEEDIIYVSKKKPRKQSSRKDRSIVKPKQNKKTESIPEQDSHPKTIIKFI
jgi:hypothetical protein